MSCASKQRVQDVLPDRGGSLQGQVQLWSWERRSKLFRVRFKGPTPWHLRAFLLQRIDYSGFKSSTYLKTYIMFSLHSDEETKTALSKPTETILLQYGDRKSVIILLLRLTRKKQTKMQRWISTLKETHKSSVKGRCNDGARCCVGTQCFFLLNFVM
jgi:hypothetical protein